MVVLWQWGRSDKYHIIPLFYVRSTLLSIATLSVVLRLLGQGCCKLRHCVALFHVRWRHPRRLPAFFVIRIRAVMTQMVNMFVVLWRMGWVVVVLIKKAKMYFMRLLHKNTSFFCVCGLFLWCRCYWMYPVLATSFSIRLKQNRAILIKDTRTWCKNVFAWFCLYHANGNYDPWLTFTHSYHYTRSKHYTYLTLNRIWHSRVVVVKCSK